MKTKKIRLPITNEDLYDLKAGDVVELSGTIFTGRDQAHKRFCELLQNGLELPIDLNNGAIFYVGPSPTKPNQVIGSAGPTSSYRMDNLTEPLLKCGLKLMIGKGPRSEEYKELLKKYHAVYLSSIGGAAAMISKTVKSCQLVAYEDLGSEAVFKLSVQDFFCIVTYDMYGNDLFEEGINRYKKC